MYKGNYVEDEKSGEGELYINGKLEYKGLWENGERMNKKGRSLSFEKTKTRSKVHTVSQKIETK